MSERHNIERYSRHSKKKGMSGKPHDTHHTLGGGTTDKPLEIHRHEYHMINPAVNRNDKPHF